MEDTQSIDCQLCREFHKPYSVGYIEAAAFNCTCGNIIKIRDHPAIYLGNYDRTHMFATVFPGCTICGKPGNTAMNISIPCLPDTIRDGALREVYHNYGGRN